MQFSPEFSSSSQSTSNLQPNSGLLKDLVLLVGIIAMFVLLWPEQADGPSPLAQNLRIVFEATSGTPETAESLLTRIENAQKNFGSQADISVVAYWDGVRMFRAPGNPLADRLASAADNGLDIIVCEQSMADAEIRSSDLLPFVRTVKSGSEEARQMEKQGWARVRDGDSYVNPL